MSRPALFAAAVALWLFCAPVPSAFAGDRLALVIGNSAYQNTPALPNPTKDAQAIAKQFKDVGFKVISAHYDVTNVAFKRAIRDFEDAIASSEPDVIVIFYAGHGIEIGGTNYMLPVDAKLASTRDAHDEAITLDRLLEATEGAKQLSLVILDACRDNPFVNMKRPKTAMLRAVKSGLQPVEPVNSNTLIAYATKTGTGAEDGTGEHSPFTVALLNHLFVPGLDVRLAFGRVRDEVMKKTRNRQEPYVTGSVGGELLTVVPAKATPAVASERSAAPAAADRQDGERTDYQLVAQVGTKRAWEVFLNQHPKGMYAELAREQLQKLASLEPPKPAEPPPGPTTEEQRVWDRIKDSSNLASLRDFIKRYPTSPLANIAQTKVDALEREAQQREEKARAEREAQAAEAARQKAEREAIAKREEQERQAKAAELARQKAEREAALKREEDERRAKAAVEAERQRAEREEKARLEREAKAAELARQKFEREAALKREEEERKVKAAEAERLRLVREEQARIEREAKAAELARQKAEREAALKREEEDRKAKAAEAERLHREREAALKREEEERKARAASEAERQPIEREAALKRAEEDRQVKAAEAEHQRREREAALKRAEEERRAKAEEAARLKAEADDKARLDREAKAAEAARQKAERDAALKRDELERQAKAAEEARQKAEREVALRYEEQDRRARAAAEAARLKAEQEEKARVEREAKAAEAARQKAEREAALKREQDERQAKIELVRTAQKELSRIGCFVGGTDGNLNSATKAAIKRYQTERGQAVADIEITDRFVSELKQEPGRTCPLVCPTGQAAEGEGCVAVQKPVPVAKQKDYNEEERRPRARQEETETKTRPVARQRDEDSRPARRREEAARPRVRQEASSSRYSGGGGGRYSGGGGGGGGGGGHGPIGVGF